MNEKIEELAKQATIRKFDGTGTDIGKLVLDEQKFAELIVKECVAIACEHNNSGEGGVVAEQIKQHFGVEE